MSKPVILTGLRSNNDLTIGNYLGGMMPIVDMARQHSDDYQINMFIPDLHSFTTPIDHSQLYEQTVGNARLFTAAGLPIDNNSIFLYRQSYVPAHSELTWILDCFTGTGEMSRMTQFKDKSSRLDNDRTTVGLFNYPVLMAADVLLYGAKYVPVGDDQMQHLEFTRDIAERMNNRFGQLFTVPEPAAKQREFFGKERDLRIMDLANPTKKMSKSDDSGKGVIFLTDEPALAAKKVMSAATDDRASVNFDRANQPGITNLLELYALLSGRSQADVNQQWAGHQRYGEFKQAVAEQVEQFLVDFQTRLAAVDDEQVIAKLEQSEAAMREQANQTLYRVQQAVGLRPSNEDR